MCDPISIGLTLAGTVMQGIGQQQAAHAEKNDIYQSGRDYTQYLSDSQKNFEGNRTTQNAAFDKNQGTVADTLATYSQPNQQKLIDDATAKRQTAYVSPLNSMTFAAPSAADAAPNSAVSNRNAATGDAAKSLSIGEALAKAKLDAYGDAQTGMNTKAASNAADINITDQGAAQAQKVASNQQNVYDTTINTKQNDVLPAQLQADSFKGSTMRSLGDMFTAAGSLASMGGGMGSFGTAGVNATPAMSALGIQNLAPINGTGIAGGFQKAFNYVSPFGATI